MNDQNLPEMTRQESVEASKKLQEIFDKQYAYLKYKALEMGVTDIFLTEWGPSHYLVNIIYWPKDDKPGFIETYGSKIMEFFK